MRVKLELTDAEKEKYGIPVSISCFVYKDIDPDKARKLVAAENVLYDVTGE